MPKDIPDPSETRRFENGKVIEIKVDGEIVMRIERQNEIFTSPIEDAGIWAALSGIIDSIDETLEDKLDSEPHEMLSEHEVEIRAGHAGDWDQIN
ncbi:hypothetical protein DM826_11840 [Halonotius aquaticus]|uniref:Uncharacterized protein n=1 Tax=Halonotius aquaticus TaxID=2216978 RepID=A0A3A6Q919_9EURY|nr:hypothetical protein [Halonotius aquaticus]RJX42326.1 hypothetical protein DM826_11840 [Halonotius aquaticus]